MSEIAPAKSAPVSVIQMIFLEDSENNFHHTAWFWYTTTVIWTDYPLNDFFKIRKKKKLSCKIIVTLSGSWFAWLYTVSKYILPHKLKMWYSLQPHAYVLLQVKNNQAKFKVILRTVLCFDKHILMDLSTRQLEWVSTNRSLKSSTQFNDQCLSWESWRGHFISSAYEAERFA